ncbi:response regulator [Candidatus Methanoperedens nitroreducens]|uniref:Response regulator n=1 Tax=Candidatus Methanoperedens nitratireducens TaxID=1392998 RepID=A0A062VDM5_9EURY|nr:response regulator [Candidatus Methanoperedens nitroreducens]KCZ73330.1 response regulator [Candidatus Methanoperedens nitroreducens]MDJ1422722.1 response regulator [Candidatus Methanoperedens sp.]
MESILVIEDDPKMRDGLVEILKDEGYLVDSAQNGQLGLDMIKKKDYDVILTDLIMPVMGGMEVLRETRRIRPKAHVILITAFATVENAVEAMKAGASEYITKPFKIDEVQTKIRKVLAEAEFEKHSQIINSDVIKAISNPIRKDAVRLLNQAGKLKFTEIQRGLGIEDATKLSFHLRVLKSHAIIEQDSEKVYMLTPLGKRLLEALKAAEL